MVERRPEYGSDLMVDLMNLHGIEYASLNPGSTFRGLHDSLVNYAGNRPRIIECCHEEIAVYVAQGYAKATGRPMAAIVHDTVGLMHATMAIYQCFLDRVPVIVIGATGPMDIARRRPNIDWIHTAALPGNLVRDYVKWDDQPASIESVPDSFARAYRVAMTQPQGPVYICLDAALQEDRLVNPVELPDLRRLAPPAPFAANEESLARVAQALFQADRPVILAEQVGRHPDTVGRLVELAELLALPVIDLGRRFNFPNTHPLDLTGSDILGRADFILALDVRDLYGALVRVDNLSRRSEYIIPKGCRLMEVGLGDLGVRSWSQDFQKLQEVDESVLADTSQAVPRLLEMCRELVRRDAPRQDAFKERSAQLKEMHNRLRQRWQEEARQVWEQSPISTARLAAEVWDAVRGEDWVLAGNTLRGWARRLWQINEPHRFPAAGMGTATQIGQAIGVALAHKGSGRLVVDIQPDGDLLYDAAALWTATHDQIPLLAVMHNNRAYYNDWEHQAVLARARGRAEENAYVGMEIDRPAPDFAQLARAFGWHGEGPIEKPAELGAALRRAIRVIKEEGRPALIDAVTQFR